MNTETVILSHAGLKPQVQAYPSEVYGDLAIKYIYQKYPANSWLRFRHGLQDRPCIPLLLLSESFKRCLHVKYNNN